MQQATMTVQQQRCAGLCSFSGRGVEPQRVVCAEGLAQHRRSRHRRQCAFAASSGSGSSAWSSSRASSVQVEAQFKPLGSSQQQPNAAQPQQRRSPWPTTANSAMAGPVAPTVGFQPDQQQQQATPLWPQPAPSGSSAPSSPQQQQSGVGKIGVLLLNLGGPDTLDDVQPFLYNLFADPDIIRLPPPARFLQPLLAQAISTLRAPKSSEGYKAIGGGSPLRRITEEQADALAASLKAKGMPANVYVGMRYWHPYTEEALEQIKRDGITQLVILPLYPQFSISTSGSSLRLLEKLFKEDVELATLSHTVIPSWYQRKGYVMAMADLIIQELQRFQRPAEVEVFFSAHGVPKSYVQEAGDPYKEEMEECVQLIMDEVVRRGFANHHTLAYQSRVGPVEWLTPYTDVSIRELGAKGVKSMLAVPVSFVSEHIETLEEIDMEYRELAEASGIHNWGRVPALNTNEVFIADLADAVIESLPFVGRLAQPNDSLVPMGELEALLEAYDRERRALPSPVVMWEWGWTKSAETWNGRLAMVALFVIVLLEITTGQSIMRSILDID